MATNSSTNLTKKPILIIRSAENPSKTSTRNVHFPPDISDDAEQVIPQRFLPSLIIEENFFQDHNSIINENETIECQTESNNELKKFSSLEKNKSIDAYSHRFDIF